MDDICTADQYDSLRRAILAATLALPKEDWAEAIPRIICNFDFLDLAVSRRAAEEEMSQLVETYGERVAAREESRQLIDAVFDRPRDCWQA